MSRGLKNNNPGNIRKTSIFWKGEIEGSDSAFETFKDMPHGYRAMFKQLQTYQKRDGLNTIEEMLHKYAPSFENHTENYIKAVEQRAKVRRNVPIDTTNKDVMVRVVAAMSFVENGKPAVISEVEEGWELI